MILFFVQILNILNILVYFCHVPRIQSRDVILKFWLALTLALIG